MCFSKAKRLRILINGKKIVGIDYPATVADSLYRPITVAALVTDDTYGPQHLCLMLIQRLTVSIII